jgi:dUTP pyrophosphatase
MLTIPIIKLSNRAVLPTRAHPGDAGADLYSAEEVVIYPKNRYAVSTGLTIAIPPSYVGLIYPRSGLALRSGITVLNAPGTIDAGYRGEVRVILINLGNHSYRVKVGNRIAQLVVQEVTAAEFSEEREALPAGERGTSGFGSTGR